MGFWNITCSVIIAIVACGSAALAGDGGRAAGVAGASRPGGAKQRLLIIRRPLPIEGPASNGTVGVGASSSKLNSRIDSKM